ncbi:hypothetical protein Pve01_37680 [Planomonospora venezuelensis]|nr:hypothetical protein Pve01_37680 [Planomonospora venezuelensis]
MVFCEPIRSLRAAPGGPGSRHRNFRSRLSAVRSEDMYEVIAALTPPVVVGGAFVYGVFKLFRSEAAGRRPSKPIDKAESQNG